MNLLDDKDANTIGSGYCPDCGQPGFRLGPRGGASQNIECMSCRARFNVVGQGWRIVWAERIESTELERRARRVYRSRAAEPRPCDYCSGTYRGPSVYCSSECSQADA